jgi:diphthamide synthase subunit DPH2
MEVSITRNKAVGNASVDIKAKIQVRQKKNVIPDSILHNDALNDAIKLLPTNYNFEIHKSIWRVQKEKVDIVALQFPEGLLMYSLIISDIFKNFCSVDTLIMGDVTYGACCIDDFTAKKLGAQMMIHYGHSCLIPVNVTSIIVMYVFVEIYFDPAHLIECLRKLSSNVDNAISSAKQDTSNSNSSSLNAIKTLAYEANNTDTPTTASTQTDKLRKRIALLGTVQFVSILHQVQEKLQTDDFYELISIPQVHLFSVHLI